MILRQVALYPVRILPKWKNGRKQGKKALINERMNWPMDLAMATPVAWGRVERYEDSGRKCRGEEPAVE